MTPAEVQRRPVITWLALFAATFATFVLAFGLAMTKGLNHDEHQHLAAGVLLARDGLFPYRDYPYFHMPYLPAIYAGLFHFSEHVSEHLLGVARTFSAICAALTVGLVVALSLRADGKQRRILQAAIAFGAALLYVTAAQFTHTTGRAWNFEAGTLCALASFACYAAWLSRGSRWYLFGAGALISLAAGIRITFAPLAGALLLLIWFDTARAMRLRAFVFFSAGLVSTALPAMILALSAPEPFFTGNFGYARIAYEYHMTSGHPRTMTVPKKLRYAFKEIIRPNWPLVLSFITAIGCLVLERWRSGRTWDGRSRIVLIAFPFLFLGSLAPSPLHEQYFYPFLPWLVLGTVVAISAISAGTYQRRIALLTFLACIVVATPLSFRRYRHLPKLRDPSAWTPSEIHGLGQLVARKSLQPGPILTFSPTAALEGGRAIYPAFTTGPFAWRVAHLVPPEQRKKLRMIAPDDLVPLLETSPPAACLTGMEEKFDEAIVDWATGAQFVPLRLSGRWILWRPAPQ